MGLAVIKPVFGVSDQVRLKPAYSATETIHITESLHVSGLAIILFNKGITNVLITGPCRAVGSRSHCRSRDCELDSGLVPFLHGD